MSIEKERRVASSTTRPETISAAKQKIVSAPYNSECRALQVRRRRPDPLARLASAWQIDLILRALDSDIAKPPRRCEMAFDAGFNELGLFIEDDPPPSIKIEPQGGLVRGRIAARPRPRFDSRGQRAAVCAIVTDDGRRFSVIARGAAAVALLAMRANAELTVVVRSVMRLDATTWAYVAGVMEGDPPAFPFFGIISGSDPGWVLVYRFDDDGPPLRLRGFRDRVQAKKFALGLAARCPEYVISVIDFTHGDGPPPLRGAWVERRGRP